MDTPHTRILIDSGCSSTGISGTNWLKGCEDELRYLGYPKLEHFSDATTEYETGGGIRQSEGASVMIQALEHNDKLYFWSFITDLMN